MQPSKIMRQIALLSCAGFLLSADLRADDGIQLARASTDFTIVAKNAIPAVVSIKVTENKKSSTSSWGSGDSEDEEDVGSQFWQRFFGFPFGQNQPSEPREGQGSGFLVSADGLIMTNGHVVKDTSDILVHLHDGREFKAKLIGQDSNTDIALIKIDASNLPFLKLGNSDAIQVGEWVVAIGTPMGLEATLTNGVVSAKGRNNLSLTRVEDFIQTNANLYLGNSGGPLLNLNSEVIGVNTAIASKMGGYIGIGFAIPSNIALNVMDQLNAKGSVSRGFMGVLLQDVNQDLATAFGLSKAEGALVAQVSKDSPAEKAGVKQGDIILSYNKIPVTNMSSLRTAIALMAPGSQLNLAIVRDRKPMQISVILGEFAAEVEKPTVEVAQHHSASIGVSVSTLTPEVAKKLGLADEKGVVITKVEAGSLAHLAGLRKSSVILAINNQKIDSVEAYQKALKEADPAKPYLFLVQEGQSVRYILIKLN